MMQGKDIKWRIYFSFFMLCLIGLAILGQTLNIQVVEGAYWRNMADSLRTSYQSIPAARGNIYSENGRLLATSLPYFEVRMDLMSEALTDKVFRENVDSLAISMANQWKDKSAQSYRRELVRARKSGRRYHLIRKNVYFPELQTMKSWPIFDRGRYRGGMIVIKKHKRETPFKMLAHRTIGYVREDVQPVGLEGSFDEFLSGENGQRLMQKIAGGTWVPINTEEEINPQDGKDLITTIDINLQDIAENALLKALTKHKADHGCAVVMEVSTGKIRAIANLGKTRTGDYWETYNYAVGEATEPGSTFKLASMIALLEEGLVDVNDSVDLEHGKKDFFDETMKDSEKHDYNNVTVQRAFEISSNVGISKLVDQHFAHQPSVFIDRIKELNLDQKSNIEIKGEPDPLVKNPDQKEWSGITLPWMAVGYEVQLTPLQTLTIYNAIANDGRMMKPYLANSIQEFGKDKVEFEPEVIDRKICSKETLGKVQEMLAGVVSSGTAKNLRTSNYPIAGKTGTAQIADKSHGYRKVYQSSFAGYFPADEPMYSCIVVINEPRNGVYYGGYVAGPVFREIADKVYATNIANHDAINDSMRFTTPFAKTGHKLDVHTIYQHLNIPYETNIDAEWVSCRSDSHAVVLRERKLLEGHIPDVTGMGLKDALYLLENSGLTVLVKGAGRVRSQSLLPGRKVSKGQQITIQLS